MEITALAIERLKEVMDEQGEKEGSLRVIAMPAEAGGLQYMFTTGRSWRASIYVDHGKGVSA